MESTQTRLLIPGLRGFYNWAEPISWLLVRITAGLMIIPHGWPKLMAGIGPTAANALAKRGIEPSEPLAVILITLETLGGLCVALGLFTRFFAAALAIEMAIALIFVHAPHGFAAGKGGYEYVLLLGIVLFAIAIRGGGRYSVDARIGKEL